MCSNPLTITRKNPATNKVHQYVVPCGKCAECTRKKQSEFGALSLHQALHSGSVHMFTFTYGPSQCPVAISELTPENVPRIVGYFRGDAGFCLNGHFNNGIIGVPNDKYHWLTASLYREDVKLVLKDFRSRWKRFYNEPLDFKYAVFGEYGEQRGRPHYHGVFFGLSLKQAELLRSMWDVRFGFAHFGPLSDNVSQDDIKKMTAYCSKYISKGVHSRWSFLEGYVEAPRRQSSLNFGDFTEKELDSLRGFYDGRDLLYACSGAFPSDFASRVLSRRSSITVNESKYPIPRFLKQKLFYEPDTTNERLRELREAHPGSTIKKSDLVKSSSKRSSVSVMVSAFARNQFDNMLDGQLRKDSCKDSEQINRWIVRQTLENENSASQAREELAEKSIIINLQNQKYG